MKVSEFFLQPGQWLSVVAAQRNYISANYTHVMRALLDRGVNVLAQIVAKERRTSGDVRYSLSCNTDLTLDLLPVFDIQRRAGARIATVGQVNSKLPFMPGDGDLPASAFDFILDDPAYDVALFAPPRNPVSVADHAAGAHAARLVADGGTLQVGIGSIGDALCNALLMRHTRSEVFQACGKRLDPAGNWRGELHDMPFDEGLFDAFPSAAISPPASSASFPRWSACANWLTRALTSFVHSLNSARADRPNAEETECLERMALSTPDGLRERVWRALLLDALRRTPDQSQ